MRSVFVPRHEAMAGFVSPVGRVRGRRRAAPSAFVVAATDRPSVEIWGDEAESGLEWPSRLSS